MRQVPTYHIIGNGRLAHHFAHYLTRLNLPAQQWHRKRNQSLHEFISNTKTIYLCIPDAALIEYIEMPLLSQHRIIHFSATFEHPKAISVHPLMTFGKYLYDDDVYRKISFVLSHDAPDFHSLLPGVPNPHYRIHAKDKAFYHSCCVLGGNFPILLWQKALHSLTTLGIPESAIMDYLKRCWENFSSDPKEALTGPLIRDDHTTIEMNLKALCHDPYANVYRAFVEMYLGEHHENDS